MADYKHPEVLVSTEWVSSHGDDPGVRLIEVDVDTSAYEKGHIKNAVGWNWTTQLNDWAGRASMSILRTVGLCLLISLTSGLTNPAFAQMTTGTILGTVTDASGLAVPGANVTITNLETGFSTRFLTDASGDYLVPYLLPGTYKVLAEKQGFRVIVKTGIVLQVDQKARVDLTLQVGAVTQSVTVQSQAPLIQTASSEQGQVVASQTISDMPLSSRDFALLVNLNTGAVPNSPNSIGSAVGVTLSRDNQAGIEATQVNGIEADGTSWNIDGVSNNEAFFSILTVNPSVDAVQEFKVTNNSYSAEYGRVGGANVQIAIKSGTNQLHGDVYEFLRNAALDANDFFSNRSGLSIPPYKQNDFGGTLGGPIKKNRAFFFGDYEGFRSTLTTTGLVTIPTAAQRTGDFSAAGNPVIYNPFNLNASGQPQPFTGNMIPSNMINSAAANILALFPPPNLNVPVGQPNFIGDSPQTYNFDKGDARVDYQLSDRDQVLTRYSWFSGTYDVPPFLGSVVGGPGAGGTMFTALSGSLNQNAVIGETHSFSPTTLNEARFGWNRVNTHYVGYDQNLDTDTQVGIPGINICTPFCGGLSEIDIAGLTQRFGHARFDPTYRIDNVFQWVDNVTLIRGKHTLKFGEDIRAIRGDLDQESGGMGEFSFDQHYTSNLGASGTGSGTASFLLGYPETITRTILNSFPDNRSKQFFWYGQDDIRVNQRLNLDLGLRWEIYTPTTAENGNQSNFNFQNGNVQVACLAISCTAGVTTALNDYGPRVGFAYTLDRSQKTVLRGGVGISYFQGQNGGFGTLTDNYPFIVTQSYSSTNTLTINTAADLSLTQGLTLPPPPQNRPGAPTGNYWFPAGLNLSASAFDYNSPNTKVTSWDLDLQRQITPTLMVDASYVANVGVDVMTSLPFNYPEPGQDLVNPTTGQSNSIQQRRPYYSLDPGLTSVSMRAFAARSDYDAFQLKIEKRTSHGLSFLAAYTNSKDLIGGELFNNPDLIMSQYSPSEFDVSQRLVVSYVYQLPFGRGKQFGGNWNRWQDAALGGWQMTGITSDQGGFPFTPTWSSSSLDNGNSNNPNRLCNGTLANRTLSQWYNIDCFTEASKNVFGNSGFDIVRGPHFADWDIGIMKNFAFTETKYLQFRTEFFNTFNEVNFGLPASSQCGGSCGEGIISSLATGYNPRLIQFALKFYF